jgi:hypothetical protein
MRCKLESESNLDSRNEASGVSETDYSDGDFSLRLRV